MLLGSRFAVVLAILISLSWTSEAIRGRGGLRRRRDGSIVFEVENSKRRRAAHWGGVADSPPPGYPDPRHAGSNQRYPKGYESSEDDVVELDDPEEQDVVFDVEEEHDDSTKQKGKQKGKRGKDTTDLNEIECDDPEDPQCTGEELECDDPNDPECNSRTVSGQVTDQLDQDSYTFPPSDMDEEDGLEGAAEELSVTDPPDSHFDFGPSPTGDSSQEPTTMERALTPFRILYELSGKLFEDDLDDGDYAELVASTDLYLTQYFADYFEGEPTIFDEVDVVIQKTDDPLIVRFFVTPSFAIPGNVPTMTNLFDRMNDAFSDLRVPEYIAILKDMGVGNPFRDTESIRLVNEAPVSILGSGDSGGSDGMSADSSDPKFLSIVISASVLVLVIGGLFWVYQQRRREKLDAVHQMELDDVEGQDIASLKKNVFSSPTLRTDANTYGYIQTIRKRFSDDAGSKTDMEDASHDPQDDNDNDGDGDGDDDDEMTEATDNRQTAAEFQDAVLNSLSYPAPPSDDDDNDDGKDDKQPEVTTESPSSLPSEYMDYLDLNDSDEEEDLRS